MNSHGTDFTNDNIKDGNVFDITNGESDNNVKNVD